MIDFSEIKNYFDSTLTPMVLIRSDDFINVNRAFSDLTEFSSNELVKMKFCDLIAQKSKRTIRLFISQLNEKNAASIIKEFQLITKTGREIWVRATFEATKFKESTALVGTLLDITNWKKIELDNIKSLDRRMLQVKIATKISQDITMIFDLNDLYERVVTLVKEQLQFYHVQIFRYDPSVGAVVLVKGYGKVGKKLFASGHKLKLGRGVVGTAAFSGNSVLASDVTIDHDFKHNPHLPDTKCELAVPIKFQGEILGILDVQSDQKEGLSLDDQILIEGLCGQIASAIEVNRLRTEIEFDLSQENRAIKAEKVQDAVYRIARAADRSKNLDDLFLDIHAIIAEVMNVENFYIALYDREKDLLSFPYYVDEFDSHPNPTTPGNGLTEYVLRTGKSLLADRGIYDRLNEFGEIKLIGSMALIWLGVPLIVNEQVIGVMTVQNYSDPNVYGDREKNILEFVSSQVAMTIKRKRSEDALRESEERFRSLFENAAIGLYRTSKGGKILLANPKFLNMLGYLSFEDLYEIDLSKDKLYIDQPRQAVLDLIEKNGQLVDFETKLKKFDGSIIYVKESTKPIFDENGNFLFYEGILEDITERKKAEDVIKRRGDEFAALYQTTSDLAWQNDLPAILNIIADRVVGLLNTSGCAIYLSVEGNDEIEVVVSHGLPEIIGIRLMPGEDIAGTAAQTLKPVILDNYQLWEHRSSKFADISINAMVAMPLIYSGYLVGVLKVFEFISKDQSPAREYSQTELSLLSVFAGTAASAVYNARLYSDTQRSLVEMEVLYKASLATIMIHDPKVLGTRIMETLELLTNWERGSIWLVDEENQQPFLLAYKNLSNDVENNKGKIDQIDNPYAFENDEVIVQVCKNGKAIRTGHNNFKTDLARVNQVNFSELCVPLNVSGRTIGCINIISPEINRFSDHDERLLNTLANQAGVMLENARLYQTTLQSKDRMSVLYKASQDIARVSQNPKTVYKVVHEAAIKLMQLDTFVITILDSINQEIQGVYLIDQGMQHPENRFPLGEGISSKIITTGIPIRISDFKIQNDGIKPYIFGKRGMTRSILAVPMRSGERIMGMISVQNYLPNIFSREDEVLLEMLAAHAGAAIENARLFEDTLQKATFQSTLNVIIVSATHSINEFEQFLQEALRETLSALKLSIGILWIASNHTGLEYKVTEGIHSGSNQNDLQEFIQEQAETRNTLVINDCIEEKSKSRNLGIYSEVVVPLIRETRFIGVFIVADSSPRKWSLDEIALIEAVGREVNSAYERLRLFGVTEKRLLELETVNRVSIALRKAVTLDEIIPLLMNETLSVLGSDTGSVWLFDKKRNQLKQELSRGWNVQYPSAAIMRGDGIFGKIFDTGDAYYSSDISKEPLLYLQYQNSLPLGWSGVCVPIMAEQEIIGALMICMPLPRQANPDDTRLLVTLAEITGNAIHRMRLHDEATNYASELEIRVVERTFELEEALKKAQLADSLKSDFIANINHELRTPLTNLILYYQLIRSQPGVKVEERMNVIGREMQRLRVLIEDLLNFSRLEVGKIPFQPMPHDLNDLLLSLVNDRRKVAEEKGIILQINLQDDLASSWMDASLMGQVISNLLTNALNYSKPQGIIRIRSYSGGNGDDKWIGFSVADNGYGITDSDFPRIFERFFRGKASKDSGASGTGLGLAIVKQVVEMHNGEISVSNGIDGIGATFSIRLPINKISRTG